MSDRCDFGVVNCPAKMCSYCERDALRTENARLTRELDKALETLNYVKNAIHGHTTKLSDPIVVEIATLVTAKAMAEASVRELKPLLREGIGLHGEACHRGRCTFVQRARRALNGCAGLSDFENITTPIPKNTEDGK